MAGKNNHDISVLFVCLGNICRSPMAEGLLRKKLSEKSLDIRVDSVGTADYHVGEPPDYRAIATAQRHGVDISRLTGRKLADEDFETFTHIYALDKANLAGVKARAPRHRKDDVVLLLDVLSHRQGQAVPDPYHGDEAEFEKCWQTIDQATDTLVLILERQVFRDRF